MFDSRILFCLLICFFYCSAESKRKTDGKVIGGQDVDIENYPYQVSLQYLSTHICGASVISEKYIFTAAHCTNEKVHKYLNICAGSSLRDEGELFKIKNIHQHPQFNHSTYDYDIAIIELEDTLVFGKKIQPIGLPFKDESIDAGTLCTVTGWGYPEEGTSFSDHLKAVQVPIVDRKLCQKYYDSFKADITSRMICGGLENGGKDACQGDSGGPLVSNSKLVGIVSWGEGCAQPKQPGVYTNVAYFRDFITGITGM